MPKLIAKERFFYAGRNVEADEEFEAEANDVALLTHSVSPRARKSDATPDPVPVEPMRTADMQPQKRTYRRRDMRATE